MSASAATGWPARGADLQAGPRRLGVVYLGGVHATREAVHVIGSLTMTLPRDALVMIARECSGELAGTFRGYGRDERRALTKRLRQADPKALASIPGLLDTWADEHRDELNAAERVIAATEPLDPSRWSSTVDALVASGIARAVALIAVGRLLSDRAPEMSAPAEDERGRSPPSEAGAQAESLSAPWRDFLDRLATISPSDPTWSQVDRFTTTLRALVDEKLKLARESAKVSEISRRVHEHADQLRFLGHDEFLQTIPIPNHAVAHHRLELLTALAEQLSAWRMASERGAEAETRAERDAIRLESDTCELEIDRLVREWLHSTGLPAPTTHKLQTPRPIVGGATPDAVVAPPAPAAIGDALPLDALSLQAPAYTHRATPPPAPTQPSTEPGAPPRPAPEHGLGDATTDSQERDGASTASLPNEDPEPGPPIPAIDDGVLGTSNAAAVAVAESPADGAGGRSGGRLPEYLRGLDAFSMHVWIRGDASIDAAPWRAPSFGVELNRRVLVELDRAAPGFGQLGLLAAAGEILGIPTLASRDIMDCARYWNGGTPDADEDRVRRLYSSLDDGSLAAARTRISAVLEALRPGPARFLNDVGRLVDGLQLSPDLAEAVRAILALGLRREDPLEVLRLAARRASAPSREAIESRLRQARDHLRALHTELTRPAWIRTTFCRHVWQSFLEDLAPSLAPALSKLPIGEPMRLPNALRVETRHKEVADGSGARFEDRARMDRRAADLGKAAEAVRDLALTLEASEHHERSGRENGVDFEVVRRALDARGSGDEEFLRRLLSRALIADDRRTPVSEGITAADFLSAPDMLLGLARDDVGGVNELPVNAFERPVVAATALVRWMNSTPATPTSSFHIRDLAALLDSTGRLAIGSRIASWFEPVQRIAIQRAAADLEREARASLANLRQSASRLAGAGSLGEADVHSVVTEGELALNAPGRRLVEVRAWLREVERYTDDLLTAERSLLLSAAAKQSAHVVTVVSVLLDDGRYDRASAIVRGLSAAVPAERARASAWRDEADLRYPTPRASLNSVDDRNVRHVVERWFDGHGRYRRSAFAKLVFGRAYEESTIDRSSTAALSIPVKLVSTILADRGFEPTFLPQLRQFDSVVVPEIPVPSSRTFVRDAAHAASEYSRDLVVLLAPALRPEQRSELLRELRKRRAAGVIADDIDLCRIVSPVFAAPDPLLALLEIAIEQLDWNERSPFRLARVEGQAVLREMYVGRAEEARELASSATYTRLFSGRKLGKSALLRFVEHAYDGSRLPSGNRLRVIYVPAVGTSDEHALVGQIIDAAHSKLGPSFADVAGSATAPADRLWQALRGYIERNPEDSLLLVLDEADAFVEHQIVEAQRRREKCLSFAMRSRMQALTDDRGLPRVRFVFTGYRATHRDEGAWANWGRALHLKPLPTEDAARLLAGPLARMGIDATEQAEVVAHRCGYQPAVLLTFGEHLVQRLASRAAPDTRARKTTVVTPDDVESVTDLEAVRHEIELIAKNNFDGNSLGLVIFGAVLATYLDIGSTAELEDLPERVAGRLIELAGSSGVPQWLGGDESAMSNIVERAVSDLVQRQLLREHRNGDRAAHALVFPHHLRVLQGLADASYLGGLVRELGQHGAASAAGDETAWLSTAEIDDIRSWCSREQDIPLLVPAVVTAGGATVLSRSRFIRAFLDALGFDRARVLASPIDARPPEFPAECCILGVGERDLSTIVAAIDLRRRVPLLVGGADLWRTCVDEVEHVSPGGPVTVVPVPLRRLPGSRVRWWFEVARGLTFAGPKDLTRIVDACAGIPFLLASADLLLAGGDGSSAGRQVSGSEIEELLGALKQELADSADRLAAGRDDWRLSQRANELLRMVGVIGTSEPNVDVAIEDMVEYWALHAEKVQHAPDIAPLALDSRIDRVALDELQSLGLLPSTTSSGRRLPAERFAAIRSSDPIRTIGRRLLEAG